MVPGPDPEQPGVKPIYRDFPKSPVWPTILILVGLAVVGGFVWGAATFAGNAAIVASAGPVAWVSMGPALVASYGVAGLVGVSIVPLWLIAGGQFFAARASGKTGTVATEMGVTFFSEAHPISRVTQRLAERMGLPPIAYIGWYPGEDINAFAMGNSQYNALIAVSKGAVERLTKQQLLAVIAHELGHVASNDMARMTQARSVQEALTFFLILRGLKQFARWVFTPLSELELLALSREREFTADRISAMMLGVEPMVSVLERLQEETIPTPTHGYTNLMMWSRFEGANWLSTHPPLELRVAKLRAWAALYRRPPDIPADAAVNPATA